MDVCKVLEPFLSQERIARIDEVLGQRTRTLTLVLESINDPHNQAACLRSCEALGVQDVHIVTPQGGYRPNHKITQGSHHWLDLYSHNSAQVCIDHLHSRGYQVASGALTPDAVSLLDLDFSKPIALAFGNEHEGLTKQFIKASDMVFRIPMLGFVQSFNISVSAGISLFQAVTWRQSRLGSNGDLTSAERALLRDKWFRQSVDLAEEILERAVREQGPK